MWASVFSDRMTDKNIDVDVEKWILEKQYKLTEELFFDFCLIGHWSYIFDSKIEEWLMRYNALQNNIPSYSLLFDDLPAVWVEVINIISSETTKAIKKKRELNKNG